MLKGTEAKLPGWWDANYLWAKLSFRTLFSLLLNKSQGDSLVAQMVKPLSAMRETWVWSLGWDDPLEKETAAHSSTLAWKIPWTEEPDKLQSMGMQRVRHDRETSLMTWEKFALGFDQYSRNGAIRGRIPLRLDSQTLPSYDKESEMKRFKNSECQWI